jgi:hypothetical protein
MKNEPSIHITGNSAFVVKKQKAKLMKSLTFAFVIHLSYLSFCCSYSSNTLNIVLIAGFGVKSELKSNGYCPERQVRVSVNPHTVILVTLYPRSTSSFAARKIRLY